MKRKLVFVDAETDGLYGGFLTVAMVAVDENGVELEHAYYGLDRKHMVIQEEWVREHVLPVLGDYEECGSEEELLEKSWSFWMKYASDAYAIADVCYPVECRLFSACVERDREKRCWQAPFPLLDLSSLFYARGVDPLTERRQLAKVSGEEHNALTDVRMSIQIWKKYFRGNGIQEGDTREN